jgi:photosystem II stability/assembly factor-like uncharacterized protein
MRTNLPRIVSVVAGCLGCFIAALSALPAVAGVNRWTAIGPDGANVVALVIDPRTPSTTFAGTRGSGVLKTVNGGATWASVNGALPTANVSALAIDPSTPTTLFAGTDAGVFKSTDGGQNWVAANSGLVGVTINALAIASGSPATLYAVTDGGVFKSINGAGNWTSINAGLSGLTARVIAIDPTSPSTIYVGVDDNVQYARNGVFKSTDAGISWARIYTTTFEEDFQFSVAAIAIDPQSPSRLYLALAFGDLVRSVDGGASWSRIFTAPQGDLWSLAIDPASSANLYAGTYSGAVWRTTDAGDHWAAATESPLASTSVNVIALAASVPATVYVGASTGIFRSSDGAQTWTHLTLGVRNISVYPLAVDPTASSTIYAAVGGAVTKTTDGGVHWADLGFGVSGQRVNSLVIDPASPSTLYAAVGALYKSTDAGAHWEPATALYRPESLAIAPSRSSTLYAGQAFVGVLKSTDSGSYWTQANNGLTAVGIYVSALAVDPTNADIVYVATPPTGRPNTDAKIFKSTNGAAQWRQVPIALPKGTSITSLVINPAKPFTIYATYANYGDTGIGGVFKSSDSGETWAVAQNGLPAAWIWTLTIDTGSPSQIYAATQDGVFRSTDAATSWTPLNSGLPSLEVSGLSIDRTGSLLRAATASGLFEYQLSGPPLPPATVVEYQNTQDFPGSPGGHFFYTDDTAEQAIVDSGIDGRFVRTGRSFKAGGTKQVCRFYGSMVPGPNSHFYTISDPECDWLKSLQKVPAPIDVQQWNYEGLSFAAEPAQIGASGPGCMPGTIPVYRAYNNAYSVAGLKKPWDSTHRYSASQADIQQMVTQFGWRDEGIAFCSPQ